VNASPRGENAASAPRQWPPHSPPRAEEAVETACARCDQPWRIHADLSGYRLRCICGGWVRVPYPEAVIRSAERAALSRASAEVRFAPLAGAEPLVAHGAGPAAPRTAPAAGRGSLAARAEGGPGAGAGRGSRPDRRAIDRAILEIVLLAIALIAPPTAALVAFGPERFLPWLPVTSLVGGVLVLAIALARGAFGVDGLRGARARHFLEAVAAAAVAVAAASGFVRLIESSAGGMPDPLGSLVAALGVPLALFVVALCPAVFEEIAFRGIVQGRLIALLGALSGVLVTAMAFALAHGVSTVTPVHLLLGAYLGFLRLRSGSLFPGMLFHGLYNGSWVLLSGAS